MIGLRRRNPWLVDAVIETEQVDNARLVIRARARHGEQSLALALNLTGEPFVLADSVEVLEAEPAVADGAVAPHGWAVISGLRPARVPRSNDLTAEWRLHGWRHHPSTVRPTTTGMRSPSGTSSADAVVSRHRGHGRPGEVVVQHLLEPVVAGEADVDQCLIETGDRSTVHLLVRTVAAMQPAPQRSRRRSSLNTSLGHRATPPSRQRAADCARDGTRG